MQLLRSILRLVPDAWPPPDLDATPDAAIIPASAAIGKGGRELLEEIGSRGVSRLIDGAPASLPADAAALIDGIVARPRTAEEVLELGRAAGEAERAGGRERGSVGLHVVIDGPLGALNARAIAAASPRIRSVCGDEVALTERLRIGTDPAVDPVAFPRGAILIAARSSGAVPIGRFTARGAHARGPHAADPVSFSFALGFRGALCDSWQQVHEANRGYAPEAEAVRRAARVIEAMREAGEQGLGAISLDGRMIDLPFIRVSEELLALHRAVVERREWLEARAGGAAG